MSQSIGTESKSGIFLMSRIEAKRVRVRALLAERFEIAAPLSQLTVEQIMTRSPVTVDPDTTAFDLVQLFYSLRFRHFPVKDDQGKVIGLISDHDVVHCFGADQEAEEERLKRVTARELMSTELVAVPPETSVAEAVNLMLQNGIHSLPVLTDGQPVGIVTSTDLYILLEELLQSARTGFSCEVGRGDLVSSPD